MTWLINFINDFFQSHHRPQLRHARCPHCRPGNYPFDVVWAPGQGLWGDADSDMWERAFRQYEGIRG